MTRDAIIQSIGARNKSASYTPSATVRFADAAVPWLTKVKNIDPMTLFIPAAGIHLGALGLYALLRKTVGKEKLQNALDATTGQNKTADTLGLGAMAAETALASSLAEREGRTTSIPVDAMVPAAVTAGIVPYLMGKAQSIPSDQDLDDMDEEWLWNFVPIIGAMRYARRLKRMQHDAELLRTEREGDIMGTKTALAPFPRLSTTLRLGVPALAGQALGGLVQEGLGNDDPSTIEGKKNRINNQLKARGIGALAGILAGVWLGRSGRMRSWKMYR